VCSETQKFGHVTFFWNGNRSGYFDEKLETYVEVRGRGRECAELALAELAALHWGWAGLGNVPRSTPLHAVPLLHLCLHCVAHWRAPAPAADPQ
jgi:hypothetical protein